MQGKKSTIPDEAVYEFLALIIKTATQGDLQDMLEHFKGYFCSANGTSHVWSSNSSWAETDLQTQMLAAAANAPLFLEAFFDACEALRRKPQDLYAPDVMMINQICQKHNIGYEINPPNLSFRGPTSTVIPVPEKPATLAEKSVEILQESWRRADELLAQGQGREAVQETLWLLESVTTAFKGVETETTVIQGKYFNQIVRELRTSAPGSTLERVLGWITSLHGYLSSPTGGGIRHGVDLKEGKVLSQCEARLFCNLMRSYLSFLLAEHERLSRK
jgi:hypothetical protein